jgi:hypothetical protein
MKKIEEISIKTVDQNKLIDFLAITLNDNEELYIDKFAIYEDKWCVDTDCIFWPIQKKHIDGKIQSVLDIDCRIKKLTAERGWTLLIDMPDFVKSILLDDFIKISNEVKFIDFIRYNYNFRIRVNQSLFMKYINQ